MMPIANCCESLYSLARRQTASPLAVSITEQRGSNERAALQRTLALPRDVEHWSLTTLREKLVKIGAKVIRHGRYVRFQMAEVAIPRPLFAEILHLIDGLRPAPLPP